MLASSTGTFFQDDEGVPDTSLLLLAAARLRDQAKEVAEEQQYIRGKPKLRPRTPPTRPRSTSAAGEVPNAAPWREQVAEWLRVLEL